MTNYNIMKFTKPMFFDEKMDGTMHIDLGLSFPETSSKAMSTIYWDILKNMKRIFLNEKGFKLRRK